MEQVRLQKARGELNTGLERVRASAAVASSDAEPVPRREKTHHGRHGAYAMLNAPDVVSRVPPTRQAIRKALAAARLRFGVRRGHGGYVPYLMVYDLVLILCLLLYLAWHAARLRREGAPTWLFWSTCYYVKLLWALGSFPYLIFIVPVLGQALHQAKPTGYDQSGMLVPQLSGVQRPPPQPPPQPTPHTDAHRRTPHCTSHTPARCRTAENGLSL